MSYCFQVRLHRFALSRNLRLHGRSVDSAEWPMAFPPATVNAFYMYSRNQVNTFNVPKKVQILFKYLKGRFALKYLPYERYKVLGGGVTLE